MKKRIICLAFTLLVIASCFAFSVSAKVYGGTSDGITWSIELNNGEMEISGNGKIPDYLNHTSTPWAMFITLAERITVGEGITSIGSNAFLYARKAHTVVLPETLESIGDNAFAYCYNLEHINLPSSLETIGNNAFASCKNLTRLDFPSSLSNIGSYAFSSCTKLSDADLSETTLTEINEGTFTSCASLKTVKLPDTVKSIGAAAFFNCVKYSADTSNVSIVSGLESVNIPSGVTYIGERAFYNCSMLTNLTFGSYPEYFCADSFYNVPAEYTVTFKNVDGSVIHSYVSPINTLAYYSGETPTAESTAQYDFTFKGWDRPFEKVVGDAVYTAVYEGTLRKYNVTYIADGYDPKPITVEYGKMPSSAQNYSFLWWPSRVPKKEGYTFASWAPLEDVITEDTVYTAVFVKDGLGDLNIDGKINDDDVGIMSVFMSGAQNLTDEQFLRANVYTADDKSDVPIEENINIKDLIFLRQMSKSAQLMEE